MANSQRTAPNAPWEERWGEFTPDSLEELSSQLKLQANELSALGKMLRERKLQSVKSDGATQFDRGLDLVRKFAAKVRYAIDTSRVA